VCHFPGIDRGVRRGNFLSSPGDHPIEPHVVLQRVGAGDVVIIVVNETNGDATGLIDLSGYRPFRILA
jgi:hypothetical protein